ncbi:hypothetical protein V8F33_004402 [Rhypophila sp. PSN 637]
MSDSHDVESLGFLHHEPRQAPVLFDSEAQPGLGTHDDITLIGTGSVPASNPGDYQTVPVQDPEGPEAQGDHGQEPNTNTSKHPGQVKIDKPSSPVHHKKAYANRRSPKLKIPWKPVYLRSSVVASFAALFGILAMTLEMVLAISVRHQGLTSISAPWSLSNLHVLWTYGPTAFLTLVSAIWARVDYEAKLSAPWVKGWNTKEPMRSYNKQDWLLLDYISMFALATPFNAFKNRDFIVLAGVVISQLLTVLIILSTSLLSLSLTEMQHSSVPVVLESRFVDDPNRLTYPATLAVWVMDSLSENFNMSYPIGTSPMYAYQTFKPPSSPDVPDTIYAPVHAMSLGLDCQEAQITHIQLSPDGDGGIGFYVDSLNTTTQACGTGWFHVLGADNNFGSFWNMYYDPQGPISPDETETIAGAWRGLCGGNPDDLANGRILFAIADLAAKGFGEAFQAGATVVDSSNTTMLAESTAVVCKPTFEFGLVNITMNAEGVQFIEPLRDDATSPSASLDHIHPWQITEAFFNSYLEAWDRPSGKGNITVMDSNIVVQEEGFCLQALEMNRHAFRSHSASVFDLAAVQEAITAFYQHFGAVLIQQTLMEPVQEPSAVTAVWKENRLVVGALTCHFMAGILGFLVLVLFAMWFLVPVPESEKGCPLAPGSIMGTTMLGRIFLWSLGLNFPRGVGGADQATLRQSLQAHALGQEISQPRHPVDAKEESHSPTAGHHEKWTKPWTLRWPSQTVVNLGVLGCIIALEITLRKSNQNQGLGDAPPDSSSLHYAWKTVPTTIFVLMNLFYSAVDFETRTRAPYKVLASTKGTGTGSYTSRRWLGVDLLRPMTPFVLQAEIRFGAWAALATSMAALLASTLPTFSGSLFEAIAIPTVTPIQLGTVETFFTNMSDIYNTNLDMVTTYNTIPSFILGANLSYPPWTYEDLVLPKLALYGSETRNNSNSSSITAIVPALRTRLSCHLHAQSEISAHIMFNQTLQVLWTTTPPTNIISVNVTCGSSSQQGTLTAIFTTRHNYSSSGYFGAGSNTSFLTIDPSACKDPPPFFYIWGHVSMPSSLTVSAMSCTEQMESLDVKLFLNSDLSLDLTTQPPQRDEQTRTVHPDPWQHKNWTINDNSVTGDLVYGGLVSRPAIQNTNLSTTTNVFDLFFENLVTSRYAIPLPVLADPPGQQQAGVVIRDAIIFQHGVIRAQQHNVMNRRRLAVVSTDGGGGGVDIHPKLSAKNAPEPGGDTGVYVGSAVDLFGRRRVVQSGEVTRILQGVLVGVLVMALLGGSRWGIDFFVGGGDESGDDVLPPRSPSSIASVLALAAGGDLWDYLLLAGGSDSSVAARPTVTTCSGAGLTGSEDVGNHAINNDNSCSPRNMDNSASSSSSRVKESMSSSEWQLKTLEKVTEIFTIMMSEDEDRVLARRRARNQFWMGWGPPQAASTTVLDKEKTQVVSSSVLSDSGATTRQKPTPSMQQTPVLSRFGIWVVPFAGTLGAAEKDKQV